MRGIGGSWHVQRPSLTINGRGGLAVRNSGRRTGGNVRAAPQWGGHGRPDQAGNPTGTTETLIDWKTSQKPPAVSARWLFPATAGV